METSFFPSEYKILIVDDSENNLQIAAKIVNGAGYLVLMASDGKSALEIINTTIPDAILLDIMMPGMSGLEVCKLIKSRQEFSSVPVLFLSARGEDALIEEGLEIGGSDYITKPFRDRVLLARIRLHIERGLHQKELQRKNQVLTEMKEEVLAANNALEKQIEKNLAVFATLNDTIRNPLTIAMMMLEMQETEESKTIISHLERIDAVIDDLDRGFLDSDKVRSYLKKHYQIG